MSVKALQDYTYYSKYARYNKEEGRRETWAEAVDRVKQMHLRRYPQVAEDIEWAFEMVKQRKVLGSQRALQFGGEPCEKKNARIFNCTSSFCDRIRFFQESFWLLLCGAGTGFSVQKHHVDKLPNFHKLDRTTLETKVFAVPDTIEGWADALGILLATYLPHSEFSDWKGFKVNFDYSLIRAEGTTLASGVGKAPGPEPLKRSLEIIRKLLDRCLDNKQKKLKSIDAYDIIMHASDAVLSGGVRRSATIALFSHDDEEMATAKTGNWFIDNPQRARSNNSAVLIRDEVSKEDFLKLMESIKQFGEPGFYWSDSTEQVPNPCFTIDTRILTESGWMSFSSILGEEVKILQDNRVLGRIENNEEFWDINLDLPNEATSNLATNIRRTGRNRDVYELELSCGRKVKATGNHHFATVNGMVKLEDLRVDDEVLVPLPELYESKKDSRDFNFGYLVGMVFGDGCFTDGAARIEMWGEDSPALAAKIENIVSEEIKANIDSLNLNVNSNTNPKFSINEGKIYGGKPKFTLSSTLLGQIFKLEGISANKDNIDFIHSKNKEFKSGFVSAMFYCDGHTEYSDEVKTVSLRLTSVNKKILSDIQLILQELGVFSKIFLSRKAGSAMLPDSNRNYRSYNTKESYRLIVGGLLNCKNSLSFLDIHTKDVTRINYALEKSQTPRHPNYSSKVKSITYIGKQDVFCLTENNRRTLIAEGMTARRCVEIGMYPVDIETGESGWQCCNLTEINGKKIKCKEDFAIAARAASIIGTLQAGYTSFPYLGKTTEKIVEREALLGVSITGMMDNPDVIFDPEVQKEMAKLVLDTNEWMAKKIGINPCARSTCIKPAGTTSCLLGTSSGIHPHHAKRYFRRTQANQMEPVLQYFKKFNPHAVDKSVWSANKKDEVVTFCVEVPTAAKTKNDLSAQDLLEYVKTTQQNWVAYGKRKSACTQPWLSHNVSNTINVRPDEWEIVGDFIYKNRKYFAGVSLLPASGDLDYPQAPFCNVLNAKEILQEYGEGCLLASGLIVDGLHAYGDLWEACNYAVGLYALDKPTQPDEEKSWELKNDWVRRVRQFAMRYCDGNIKKCTYMLKHVNNWKIWLDLTKEYKEVDYTQFLEDKDYTKPMDTIACAGGKCELN